MFPKTMLGRTEVRQVACPKCLVQPDENCQGVRRVREANHQERVNLASRRTRST